MVRSPVLVDLWRHKGPISGDVVSKQLFCFIFEFRPKISLTADKLQGCEVSRRHHCHGGVLLAIHQCTPELGLCCILAEYRSADIDSHSGDPISIRISQHRTSND